MSDQLAPADRARVPWFLPAGVLALAGILLILAITRFGPGASGDSAYYVMGAQNMLAGNGFSRTSGGGEVKPITGFPPVFSAVLAAIGWFGGDLFQAARYLNAVLFALNIFMAGGLVYRYTRNLWPTVLACAALLTADNLVGWHAWVMSEPLYITLMLIGFYALQSHIERPRTAVVVGLGACLAAATLTRYIGLALVVSSMLSIMLLSRTSLRRRILDCVVLGAISIVPVDLWLRRNVVVAGTGTNRALSFHPMSRELLLGFVGAFSDWIVPRSSGLPGVLRAGIAAAVGLIVPAAFMWRSWWERRAGTLERWRARLVLPWILIFYIGSHMAVVYINSTFLDAATTLSAPPRYLLPAFVAAVILFACLIFRLLADASAGRWARSAVTVAVVGLLVLYAKPTLAMLRDPIPDIGYTGLRYTMPDVVRSLEQVGPGVAIVSNNPELVYILIGRPAYMRPILFDAYRLEYRQDFEQQIADVQAKLDQGGVLILFGDQDPEEQNVLEALKVKPFRTFDAATMYVAAR